MIELREIESSLIEEAIKKLIYDASFSLRPEVEERLGVMMKGETNPLSAETLKVFIENANIARQEELPLCQDCGMAIIFLEIGQRVILRGDDLDEAVNRAVAWAYDRYYLRKSIVGDPLKRTNTGTNTPASIHSHIVPGSGVKITVYLKGGGSENMTDLRMFRPTDSVETIIDHVEQRVVQAGPNPCPPLFLGIGMGGSADTAILNAKLAVMRGVGSRHPDPFYADLEKRIEERLNDTGVGSLGFGGRSTVGGVFIKTAPAHIASLPVALNMNCHSLRYGIMEI
jgi:fumarate hydratase subunit alpha